MSKTKNNGADEPSATNAKQSDLADLVLAPGGPRPRSRLHRVPPHHVIRYRMGTVHIVDLSTGDDVARIDPPDRNIAGPLGNGWIVFAKYVNDTGSPITAFTTRWTVPEPPRTNSGQTIYLFNAMLDAGERTIVQPVLQWGVSDIGGGPFWTIANWHVTPTGDVLHSDPVPVRPHDTLIGSISLVGSNGNGNIYLSEFAGEPSTRMTFDGLEELTKCTETLETRNITACSDYPASASTAFTGINIRTGASTPSVSWAAIDQVTDCGQSARILANSGSNGAVTLQYP